MAESSSNLTILLSEAVKKIAQYNWLDAVGLYEKALEVIGEKPERARITSEIGRSYFQSAFQSDSRREFKELMVKAKSAYDSASALYGSDPKSELVRGKSLYASLWEADDYEERKTLLKKALLATESAAASLDANAERAAFADAKKDVLTYRCEALTAVQDHEALIEDTVKALKVSDEAVRAYKDLDPTTGLLECMKMSLQLTIISATFGVTPRNEGVRRAMEKEAEMRVLARKIGNPFAFFLEAEASGMITHELLGDFPKALKIAEEGLEYARETRDKDLIGAASIGISQSLFWMAIGEEDTGKKRDMLERDAKVALQAYENFQVPLMKRGSSGALESFSEAQTILAVVVETDPAKKKQLLRHAIEISRRGLEGENEPWIVSNLSHSLSKALLFLATLDLPNEEKSRLLEEALRLRQAVVQFADTLMAPNTWDQGVSRNYLALIKSELANINPDRPAKIQLLESACSDMQTCLAICSTSPNPGQVPVVAQYAEWYGDVAAKLLDIAGSSDASKQATDAYNTAIEYQVKAGHEISIPNLRWKLARAYDLADQNEDASREFQRAAEEYRSSKLQGCDSCFNDMALYMEAWSLIEKARMHHSEEQYLLAAEEYQKASKVLKQTAEWAPLSKHYLGCSYLEGGEALGRQERPDSSKESFRAAISAFNESKTNLESLLKAQTDSARVQEIKDWVELDKGSEKYSQARIQLEEAKLLDKTGGKEASASKYRGASTAFKVLMGEARNEQSKSEFNTLGLLCDAWAKMKEAEANASPDLYASAAQLFLETEKATKREKLRVLAMANASICKALEAGTKFRRTRDTDLYGEIKKQLEASADYYREAGFKNAADWTRATQRMFDALVYLTEAEVERDPRKKTEHYHLAEKHLQLAARLYGDAGFQAKRDEALAHLERAKEEKALLMSPLDALAGNPVDSTVSMAPISLVQDQSLGLERFEEASVVGTMRVPAGEVGVGSDVTLELEFANVGKTAATLMKLENIFAEGLELDAPKAQLRVEGNFVDLKGKRLEYLKTHDLKIPLKARRKGSYKLRPRIMFVDERGTYKSYDFEPVALNVRELGISGWLKGPK